jgi:hypothetical protein
VNLEPDPDASIEDLYASMLSDVFDPWCWACGRGGDPGGPNGSPDWWHGPWIIHRHHVVKSPRVRDRRAVVLLCPVSHGSVHGERYPSHHGQKALTLAEQLWLKLKLKHDPTLYDRAFLARHHLGRLPRARRLSRYYLSDYCRRRGPGVIV